MNLVVERLGTVDSVPEISGGDHPYAGLINGSAGPALLFLRLYERTGNPALQVPPYNGALFDMGLENADEAVSLLRCRFSMLA